ncbi:MAG: hypothetical protein AWM53_01873 [Candidatus Dichloromethanomonas elyunquensis]|nr:MAG: hypothetical protein AWM53_01873 [Candidatus Dichloromethanomonas elyunquensis]
MAKNWFPVNDFEVRCSCGCDKISEKKVLVEYLYLDLQTCDRCVGTNNVLDEVMLTLVPTLQIAGYEVNYNKVEIETEDLAEKYQFLSSPTIRVNGQDICELLNENSCGCCSKISEAAVDCRIFEYEGATYEVPPKEMLAEAILKTVFGTSSGCDCREYKLPDNLKAFFEGKNNKSSCSSGSNCR